jgi:hypothetical protein
MNELLNMLHCPSCPHDFTIPIGYKHRFLAGPPEF